MFSVHNTIRLSRHEQICIIRLRFGRYFCNHQEKYLLKRSLIKHTCSWLEREILKYFWLTTMLVMLERKPSLVSIKKFWYQCHSNYTRWVKSHRVLYLSLLGSYNICIIYLHVLEACLNVTIVMLYFFHLKNISNVFHNIWSLWISSLFIFEKKVPC